MSVVYILEKLTEMVIAHAQGPPYTVARIEILWENYFLQNFKGDARRVQFLDIATLTPFFVHADYSEFLNIKFLLSLSSIH